MVSEVPAHAVIAFHADALLFDSDGVLVDSHDAVRAAWTRWAQLFDLDPATVLAHVHGRTARETVAHFLDAPLQEKGTAVINRLEQTTAGRVRAMPGALDCVATLDANRWALVTSGTAQVAQARLRAAGIPMPAVVITASDVKQGKPSPLPYLLAADRLHVPANVCLVFEDAPAGVTAARAAGVRHVVGVGQGTRGLDVDAHVRDLRQVRLQNGQVNVHTAR